jgi:hypothetical protein
MSQNDRLKGAAQDVAKRVAFVINDLDNVMRDAPVELGPEVVPLIRQATQILHGLEQNLIFLHDAFCFECGHVSCRCGRCGLCGGPVHKGCAPCWSLEVNAGEDFGNPKYDDLMDEARSLLADEKREREALLE